MTADYQQLQVQQSAMSDSQIIAQAIDTADTIERANIDTQVSTAKRFPRDVKRSLNNAIAIATLTKDAAQKCSYALPRGNKPITGPSVHLAKIIVSCWGNMRVEAKVVAITDRQVVSRGTAWDLENNVATAFEVRRSIMNAKGQRYTDDMITVTGNAANAIAYRNAVFAVVPEAITSSVYSAAQREITGELSSEEQIIKARKQWLDYFRDNFGITEQEVLKLIAKPTINNIVAKDIVTLNGIAQSLNDGDTTVDELMADIRGHRNSAVADKLASISKRKAEQQAADAQVAAQDDAQAQIQQDTLNL
jgi:hypothetical protein